MVKTIEMMATSTAVGIPACRIRAAPFQARHHGRDGIVPGLYAVESQFAADTAHGFSPAAVSLPDPEPGIDPPDTGCTACQLQCTQRRLRAVDNAGQCHHALAGLDLDLDGAHQVITHEAGVDGRGD